MGQAHRFLLTCWCDDGQLGRSDPARRAVRRTVSARMRRGRIFDVPRSNGPSSLDYYQKRQFVETHRANASGYDRVYFTRHLDPTDNSAAPNTCTGRAHVFEAHRTSDRAAPGRSVIGRQEAALQHAVCGSEGVRYEPLSQGCVLADVRGRPTFENLRDHPVTERVHTESRRFP